MREILDLGSGESISENKCEGQLRCFAQLISPFVFAYAKSRYSHDASLNRSSYFMTIEPGYE